MISFIMFPCEWLLSTYASAENLVSGSGLNMNEVLVSSGISAERATIAVGWTRPSVVELINGEILAMMHRSVESSKGWYEEIGVSRSQDGGRTWSEPVAVLPGRDAYLGVLSDGMLLVCHFALPRDAKMPSKGFISCSTDNGVTWELGEIDARSFAQDAGRSGGSRTFIELDDEIILAFACVGTPRGLMSYSIRSKDKGRTWDDARLAFEYADEVSAVKMCSGKIIAATRIDGPQYAGGTGNPVDEVGKWHDWYDIAHPIDFMAISESNDNGDTWSTPCQVLPPSVCPGQLLLLNDGRLLLTYGVRHFPKGAQAILSDDEGKTWNYGQRFILAWHGWDSHSGYPWSIQLQDGDILTAYYLRRGFSSLEEVDISEIASEVIRWRLPGE